MIDRASEEFVWLVGAGKGILASLSDGGIVSFAIEAGEGSPVKGTDMFARMMAQFGERVTGIQETGAMEQLGERKPAYG